MKQEDSRERILQALEAGRGAPQTPPIPHAPPPLTSDPIETLRARLAQNGGRLARAAATDWTSSVEWPEPLERLEHVYVGSGVTDLGHGDPNAPRPRGVGRTATTATALAPLELCLLAGRFAVIENGAVWHVPSGPLERAAALLAQHLVILVDAHALVETLHAAYARVDLASISFGWLLSGPSKTADIEQALVLGAHGPRSMQLLLIEPRTEDV